MEVALFYLCALGALLCAVGVVVSRQPLNSVLALLGSFGFLAVIYLLAGFAFLAAAQILVYAGAIMVLFLFVIMLLNLADPEEGGEADGPLLSIGRGRAALGMGAAGLLLSVGLLAILGSDVRAAGPAGEEAIDDLHAIAGELFGQYLLPFEAASLLLLATMVGVIVLAKRQRGAGVREHGVSLGDTSLRAAKPEPGAGESPESAT